MLLPGCILDRKLFTYYIADSYSDILFNQIEHTLWLKEIHYLIYKGLLARIPLVIHKIKTRLKINVVLTLFLSIQSNFFERSFHPSRIQGVSDHLYLMYISRTVWHMWMKLKTRMRESYLPIFREYRLRPRNWIILNIFSPELKSLTSNIFLNISKVYYIILF